MTVILVGKCGRVKDGIAQFDFKGHFKQTEISKIVINSQYEWHSGSDYVVHLKVKTQIEKTLICELLRAKKI